MSSPASGPSLTHGVSRVRANLREPGRQQAEPGRERPEPGAIPIREKIDDHWLMAFLIPSFGLVIPHATGLFGPLGPTDAAWWWGHAWFVGGAATIYLANRTLLFAGRTHADWFSRPVARLVLLATGIVFGTVPPTWLMLHFWSALSGVALGEALQVVVLVNIICVLFVTWLYEMLFLIRERVDDQALLARAELDALRAQVDPHFLFNALNTLAALVEADPLQARRFVDDLARVYRALLDTRGRTLVPLSEELELATAYAELLRVRFGGAVVVTIEAEEGEWEVPPGAAQVLLENAVRHNAVDPDAPLDIHVRCEADELVVAHDVRPRPPAPGAGTGLANLDARARAASGRGLRIERGEAFVVGVPMVAR